MPYKASVMQSIVKAEVQITNIMWMVNQLRIISEEKTNCSVNTKGDN